MIEQLFGSKTRVKLLQLFLANPGRSFYVRELTRKIDEQINSVRRELSNLLGIGIIKSDSVNNKLYYEVNQGYKHFKALQSIFSVEIPQQDVSRASQGDLLKRLQAVGSFDVIIATGILVGQEGSEIDLILVGSSNKQKLEKLMKAVELEEGAAVRYTVMPESELKYRLDIKDRFIITALTSKHRVLVDESGLVKQFLGSK
ncbi:MAG TPA: transcriptional regulator [Candidatus Saccharibacteria bacterium]|nr:transcriptional regulator [Candidatus Saccharibacteria bacterium]